MNKNIDRETKLAAKWYDNFTKTRMDEAQGIEFLQECGDAETAEKVMYLIALRKNLLGD